MENIQSMAILNYFAKDPIIKANTSIKRAVSFFSKNTEEKKGLNSDQKVLKSSLSKERSQEKDLIFKEIKDLLNNF